jgi:hypothetical protein
MRVSEGRAVCQKVFEIKRRLRWRMAVTDLQGDARLLSLGGGGSVIGLMM